ncbi:hypothetical protein [Kocuria sp. TGY1127_2]|uniref:hypothetical protein n=1 Tax=Kocuria sp. TGY1127_2 TaxID=2711328 RepID=UPI0015C043DC|nr:hypothetical protein [Kocuria sp. TGY1127_2]
MDTKVPVDREIMPTPSSSAPLKFADLREAKDLATLLSRVRSIDSSSAVRLQAHGSVVAVWVPVMSAETLLEQVPTVLGMRALHLSEPSEIDVTVEAAAVLDRLARIDKTGGMIEIPPTTVHAPWSGIVPPSSGWIRQGHLDSETVETIARDGMSAVEQALPSNPGGAVVSTVRARIWGTATSFDMVSGAAFGATVLGFNESVKGFDVYTCGPWHRISNESGHILSRPGSNL